MKPDLLSATGGNFMSEKHIKQLKQRIGMLEKLLAEQKQAQELLEEEHCRTEISLRNAYQETKRCLEIREQQLIHADKLASIGTLVSSAVHEIANPNNFISMNTTLLRKVWEDSLPIFEKFYAAQGDFLLANIPYSEIREYIPELIDGIREGAERIRQIVSNLKDYARKDSSDMTQYVDVNKAVRTALSFLDTQIRKSTDRFSVNYAECLPGVQGNFQRIEQVIVNLIQNACQAVSDRNQRIDISTCYDCSEDKTVVRVQDEGVGISQEDISRILDPFFTTKQNSGGTGLGLSVCAEIVKEHSGNLVFSSEPEKGTTVLLILPAVR